MYVIRFKTGKSSTLSWEDFTKMTNKQLQDIAMTVDSVTVTGKEIQRVVYTYNNIPGMNQGHLRNQVTWFGDHARFIIANMVP